MVCWGYLTPGFTRVPCFLGRKRKGAVSGGAFRRWHKHWCVPPTKSSPEHGACWPCPRSQMNLKGRLGLVTKITRCGQLEDRLLKCVVQIAPKQASPVLRETCNQQNSFWSGNWNNIHKSFPQAHKLITHTNVRGNKQQGELWANVHCNSKNASCLQQQLQQMFIQTWKDRHKQMWQRDYQIQWCLTRPSSFTFAVDSQSKPNWSERGKRNIKDFRDIGRRSVCW